MSNLGQPSKTLDAVKLLAPQIAAAAVQNDEDRMVSSEIVEKLREAGIFRMMIPTHLGGDGLTMSQAAAVIEQLGATDGASAWTAMVAFGFNLLLARCQPETIRKLLADGADLQIRGNISPIGRATRVEGGYKMSGRWPFASGPYAPKYMVAGCIIQGENGPEIGPNGPEIRVGIIPTEKVKFLDTWNVVGLKGTDSRDYEFEDVFVAEDMTANPFDFAGPQYFGDPLFNAPFPILAGPTHSCVSLGIVRASLHDLAVLAKTKRSTYNPTQLIGESQVFQHAFAELTTRYEALKALLNEQCKEVDALAVNNQPVTPEMMVRHSAWTGYLHAETQDIVNECFTLAGSTPVYTKSELQRRWRDIRVVSQHFAGTKSQYPAYATSIIEAAAA